MKYPYLTLLELINIIGIAILEMVAFYILIKLFKKEAKLKTTIKSFWLFALISIIVSIIVLILNFKFAFYMFFARFNLDPIIIDTGLFLAFYYILKQFLSINWKKSLLIFFICFFFVFPLISNSVIFLTQFFMNKSPFREDFKQLTSEIETYFNLTSLNLTFFNLYSLIPCNYNIRTPILGFYPWNLNLVYAIESGLHGISSTEMCQDMMLVISGITRLVELLKPPPY